MHLGGITSHVFAQCFSSPSLVISYAGACFSHFQRHFLAPRASTQDTMNLCFQGLEVELAERYTNMTKIMFLAFWYCSIFPQALFLAAVALLVNYYTDRFSLMRTWKRAPRVSTEISHYSRLYFFSSACIFLAGMSSFYWSAYPFDNLCLVEDQTINETYVGSHTVSIADRFNTEIRVEQIVLEPNSKIYKFCEQDYILGSQGTRYPFFADEWMGENQRWVATLFAWTSVGVMSLVGAKFLVSGIYWVQSLFAGAYMVCFTLGIFVGWHDSGTHILHYRNPVTTKGSSSTMCET